MADNIIGNHVQGCEEEGTPASAERPVLIAGEDHAGNIKIPVFENDGSLDVTIVAGAGGGGPVTIADGADVAEGTTTDAAITTDSPGTVIGFLRGLVKMISSVWDNINGRLKVDVQAAVTTTDFTTTGTLTAPGQTLTLTGLTGCSNASFQVTGVWSGLLVTEGTMDGSTWAGVSGYKLTSFSSLSSSFSGNGILTVPCADFTGVRLRASSFTSGTATVTIIAGAGASFEFASLIGSVSAVASVSALPPALDLGGCTIAANGVTREGDVDFTDPATAGFPAVMIEVRGPFVGTIAVRLKVINSYDVQIINAQTGEIVSSITAVGIYRVEMTASARLQLVSTAWTSGTAAIHLYGGLQNPVVTVIPGTGATNIGKASNASHLSGNVGVMSLAVRNDGNLVLADASGKYTPVQVITVNDRLVLPVYDERVKSQLGDITLLLMEIRDILQGESIWHSN